MHVLGPNGSVNDFGGGTPACIGPSGMVVSLYPSRVVPCKKSFLGGGSPTAGSWLCEVRLSRLAEADPEARRHVLPIHIAERAGLPAEAKIFGRIHSPSTATGLRAVHRAGRLSVTSFASDSPTECDILR